MIRIRLIIFFILTLLASGTSDAALDIESGESSTDTPPPKIEARQSRWTGQWISVMPSKADFNQNFLETTSDKIGQMEGIYSLLVVRNGYLVLERYFREGSYGKPHNIKSASKSVLSALIGIAIDEGKLHLDQPICDLLPQCKKMNDSRKLRITVRHLLTMTSGLKPSSYDSYYELVANGDWIKAVLDQPLIGDPGKRFQYSTGDAHILSAVLTAATGMSTMDYAMEKLFGPMNIRVQGWTTDPNGIYQGGNNLALLPRDIAKIGQLYLDGGTFGVQQIVPRWWVDVSTRAGHQGVHDIYGRYGYLWYSRPDGKEAYVAVGYGGQYIYVSPPYDCVVVVTSTLESKGRKWERKLFELIRNGILGSIQIDPRQLSLASGLEMDTHFLGSSAQNGEGRAVVRLNLRKGPNQTERIVTTLDEGSELEIKEKTGPWLRVQAGRLTGWVAAKYVQIIPAKEKPVQQRREGVMPVMNSGSETALVQVQLEAIQKTLHDQKVEGRDLRLELASIIDELENGRLALSRSEAARRELESELAQILSQNAKLDKTRQADQANRDDHEAALSTVQSELESAKKALHVQMTGRQAFILKVAGLNEELKKARQVSVRSEAARKELESELDQILKQNSDLNDHSKTLQSSRDDLKNEMASARKELEKLELELEKTHAEKEAIRAELEPLHRELQVGQAELEKAADKRKEQDNLLAKLQAQHKAMEKTFQDRQKEQEKLASKLAAVNGELAKERQAASQYLTVRGELESELAQILNENIDLAGSLKKAEDNRKVLMGDLDLVRKEVEDLSLDLKKTIGEKTASDEAQKRLVSQLADLRVDLQASEKKAQDQQMEREGLIAKLAVVNAELKKERQKAARSETDRQESASELAAQNETLKTVKAGRDDLKAKLSAANNKIENQNLDLKKTTDEKAVSDEAQKKLVSQLAELGSELQASEKKVQDQNAEREGLIAKLDVVNDELEKERQKAARSETDRQKLASELAAQNETLKTVKAGRDDLKAKLSAANNKIENQNLDLNKITDEKAASDEAQKRLVTQLAVLGAELQASEKMVQDQNAEREGLTAKLAVVNDELDKAQQKAALSESERTAIASKLAVLDQTLNTVNAGRDNLRAELASAYNKIESQNLDLKMTTDEKAASDEAQKKLVSQLADLRAELQSLGKMVQDQNAEREGLTAKLAVVNAELDKAQQKAALSESERTAIASKLAVLDQTLNTVNSGRDNLKAELASAHHKIENQNLHLNKMTDEKAVSDEAQEKLVSQLADLRAELQSLGKKVQDQNTEREGLTTKLAVVNDELDKAQQKAALSESERKAIASKLAVLNKTLNTSKGNRDDLLTDLSSARDQIGQLQKALKASKDAYNKKSSELAKLHLKQNEEPKLARKEEPVRRETASSEIPQKRSFATAVQAAQSPAAPVSGSPDIAAIEPFVNSWAEDWERKDVEAYLANYSRDFNPNGGISQESWHKQRRKRLLKPAFVQITIANVRKEVTGPSLARVTFNQFYQSDTYKDEVIKTLDLKWENQTWNILAETSKKQ